MSLMLLGLLTGCWKNFNELPQMNRKEFPFSNPNLQTENVYIQIIPTSLTCPDGKDASFFVVYPESDESLPVALVFHSGPIGFVSEFFASQGRFPERLTTEWAQDKVWETLGMTRDPIDPSENNQGTMTTALADAGFIQIYPMNCWGDYWHSHPEIQANGESLDTLDDTVLPESLVDTTRFSRHGLEMAVRMIEVLESPEIAAEEGFEIPRNYDPNLIYWVGLGEGGRAIIELLKLQQNPPQALLLDSTPMDLQPFVTNYDAFPLEAQTIDRVFVGESGYPIADLSPWSYTSIASWPSRSGLIWSNSDSRIPRASIQTAAEELAQNNFWVYEANQPGHVFINGDIDLARGAVNFLLTGEFTTESESTDTDNETSTEQ